MAAAIRLPHPVTGAAVRLAGAAGDRLAGRPGRRRTPRWPGRPPRYVGWPPGARRRRAGRAGLGVPGLPAAGARGARTSPGRASGRRSPTSRTGAGPVRASATPSRSVLVVGLAPAANGTNRTGRMFTGDRSGDWLYAALHRAGLRQPADERGHAGDGQAADRRADRRRRPLRAAGQQAHAGQERDTCGPWLDRDLALAAPTAARRCSPSGSIALGRRARRAPAGSAGPCRGRSRGSATAPRRVLGHDRTAEPIRLLASYHVSQQNTFTGKLTEAMLDAVIARL